MGMSSSSLFDSNVNLVSGLEDKVESGMNALEIENMVEGGEEFVKQEYENVEEEAPGIVVEDEQDDFPGLSPLRGDCVISSSDIGTGVEAEYMNRMFEDDRGCENLLFSSRGGVNGPLVDVNGDLAKQGDGFYWPPNHDECMVDSEILRSSSMIGKNRSFSNVESHKLKIAKEQLLGDLHAEHELSCSAQESTFEPMHYSAVEGSNSEKLSHPSTSFGCCLEGTTELNIMRSCFDSLEKTSTLCTNDKEFYADAENVGSVFANSSPITLVRRMNPKRGASLKSNLADGKFNQLNTSQSDRRKCRRKVSASTSFAPTTLKVFGEVKKKRRNSHRKARLSVWGTIENLLPFTKQRDELINHDLEPRRSNKSGAQVNRRKKAAALKKKQSRLSSNRTSNKPETSCSKFELEQNCMGKGYSVVSSNMREGQLGERDLDSTLTQEAPADNLLSECHGVSSRVNLEFVADTLDDKQTSNLGNSPDSDVYNPASDADILTGEGCAFIKLESASNQSSKIQEPKEENGLPSAELAFIKPVIARLPLLPKPVQASENLERNPAKSHKRKMKEKNMERAKKRKTEKREMRTDLVSERPLLCLDSSISGLAGSDNLNVMGIQNTNKITESLLQNDGNEQLEAFLPSDCVKECQVQKSTKKRLCKIKSSHDQHEENKQKSEKVKMDNQLPKESDNLEFSPGTINKLSLLGGQMHELHPTDALPKDLSNEVATAAFGKPSSFSGKKAWALCDDCQKWRCVPDELVHVIEKNKWTCKDNVDEAFADCAIPQEKTDDEINNDLGISVLDYCSTTPHIHGESAPLRPSDASRTMWTRIKSNSFLHRNRRTLTIDEVWAD